MGCFLREPYDWEDVTSQPVNWYLNPQTGSRRESGLTRQDGEDGKEILRRQWRGSLSGVVLGAAGMAPPTSRAS